jgi:hypothetical protein
MRRPLVVEYTAYHSHYIENVPYGDPLVALERQAEETARLLSALPEERGNYRYAPGKWSIKELVGHVIDTERIFAYRCLAIARGDITPLPGFDQDTYVARAGFDGRSLQSLIGEMRAVRAASLALFRSLGEEAWNRAGTANGKHLTARVFPWIAAGHEHHHVQVLRERYLGPA